MNSKATTAPESRWPSIFDITVVAVLAVQTVLVWSIDLDLRAIRRRMLHGPPDRQVAVMKPDSNQGAIAAP